MGRGREEGGACGGIRIVQANKTSRQKTPAKALGQYLILKKITLTDCCGAFT